jgi:hypothetical protein
MRQSGLERAMVGVRDNDMRIGGSGVLCVYGQTRVARA